MKIEKGNVKYYQAQKKKVIVLTVLYFAISIAVFLLGYFSTKTRANLLTIVAVLGLLPASRSAVDMIMYIKNHGCDENVYQRMKSSLDNFVSGFGYVFTTYKLTYSISCLIIKNQEIYILMSDQFEHSQGLEEHIRTILKQNGYKCFVSTFQKEDEFLNRCSTLESKENVDNAKDLEIKQILNDISL